MIFKKHLIFTLSEGKIDDVNDKHVDIPEHVKSTILSSIPHSNAQHYDWALTQHTKNPIDPDDLHKTLSTFNANKDKLTKKNIHQYKSLDDLKSAVSPFQEKPKEHTVIYDSPSMRVTQHHTYKSTIEAAKLDPTNPEAAALNCKAKWCISADSDLGRDRYNGYTAKGNHPVYTIDDKVNNRKYALVANPNDKRHETELRDEHDNKPYVTTDERDYEYQVQSKPDQNHMDLFINNHPEIMKTPLKSYMSGEIQANKKNFDSRVWAGEYTNDDVDKIFSDPTDTSNRHFMASYNPDDIKQHHIDKFMKDYAKDEEYTREYLTKHPLLRPEHIDQILKGRVPFETRKVLTNPNVTSDNLKTALSSNDYKTRVAAITHPKATQEMFRQVINHDGYDETPLGHLEHLSKHIHPHDMDEDTLNHYFKSRNISVPDKVNAINNNLFITPDNLKVAYQHGMRDGGIAVVHHPLVTKEILTHAMKHGGPAVKSAATEEYNKRYGT